MSAVLIKGGVRRGPNSENATGNTKASERKQGQGAIYEHVLYAMRELCQLALYVRIPTAPTRGKLGRKGNYQRKASRYQWKG